MNSLHLLRNTQIIILGVCIASATIVSTVILSKGLLQIKKFTNEVIEVTGSAEKQILSDYSVWRLSFSRRHQELKTAYQLVQEDLLKVKAYLISKGIAEQDINILAVDIVSLYKYTPSGSQSHEIEAYQVTQPVEVRSSAVRQITDVSRQVTELINQDISLVSNSPEYFYTRLADLKIEMLEQATEDAKERASTIASSTGNAIGFMRSARMGVFQITPADSYDVSWCGINSTASLEKRVTAVVRAVFAIKE